jgi:hypothetical protein
LCKIFCRQIYNLQLEVLLRVILNLSSTIAVKTVVVTYPATAIATWANLHCQRLHVAHGVMPSVIGGPGGCLGFI